MYMSSIVHCRSLFINVYEQYCPLSVTVHQCIWAVLSTVGHCSSMYMSSIIYCRSPFIKVYEQYHLLSVTVHQCIWAVSFTVGHRSSMYMSSIIYCRSQVINVYEQYCLLSVTVHQCIWVVLSWMNEWMNIIFLESYKQYVETTNVTINYIMYDSGQTAEPIKVVTSWCI